MSHAMKSQRFDSLIYYLHVVTCATIENNKKMKLKRDITRNKNFVWKYDEIFATKKNHF